MTENNTFYCTFVGNQYIICECGEAFPNEDELREHLERDPHNNTTTFTEYKCGECSKIYSTEQECVDHQDLEHVPYMKDQHSYMKEEAVQIKEEPTHLKEESLYLKDEPLYIDNQPVYVKVEDVEGEQYYVEQVITEAETGTVLEIVDSEVAEKDSPLWVDPKPRGRTQTFKVTDGEKKKKYYLQKNVICEVCGKKYASAAALRYHQRVHTGVRPFQCSYCPKNFTMSLFLQIHIRTHTGERPYQCTQCPKAFSNRAALLRHDRVHTGVKPYECPKCGKTFTQSNSMKLHVHTVHLKMPAPYKSKRRKAESLARRARRAPPPPPPLCQVQILEPKLESDAEASDPVYYCALPDAAASQEGVVAYELIY